MRHAPNGVRGGAAEETDGDARLSIRACRRGEWTRFALEPNLGKKGARTDHIPFHVVEVL